jgi:trehalose 6-phosphate synthase
MQSTLPSDPHKDELFALLNNLLSQRHLIVGTNRGPLEFHLTPGGQLQPRRGSGAVVTALNSLIQAFEFTWVANTMGEGDRRALEQAGGKHIASPLPNQQVSIRYVVTPRRVYHKFYNILCNPLLWFLQHSLWSPPYTPNIDSAVYDAWTTGYIPVNRALADAIIDEANTSATPALVMLHDYHLYLTAGMVRQALPEALIQHFIHIPWPAPQAWLLLPRIMRNAICESLCSADIVGFQSFWDTHAFLESCRQFLPDAQVDFTNSTVDLNGHRTLVQAYPTSIDLEEMAQIGNSPRALEYEARLKSQASEHTIVRVDRTEPSKNIIRGFRAYEIFLERHPELHGRVTFFAFLVPSRTHIKQYERYTDETNSLIRNINSTYGTDNWSPIHAFEENNYTQAIAGMRIYDSLLVNPISDGMGLVAKEGPVVNTRDGVLILSESTGSFPQLKDAVLAVGPADLEATAEAFYQAVIMSTSERAQRASFLVETIGNENATHWLLSQMRDLAELL